MTLTFCQKFGLEKFGAVTHCPACGYCPVDDSDRDIALSILLSDHYKDIKNLSNIGRDISSGVNVQVDQQKLDHMTQILSNHLNMLLERANPQKSGGSPGNARASITFD